jgi:hypothetical protein
MSDHTDPLGIPVSGRPDDDATMTIRIPADPRFIRVARLAASGVGQIAGMDADGLDDLRVATGEACSWLLERGTGGRIAVRIRITGGALEVHCETAGSADVEPHNGLAEQIMNAVVADYFTESVDGISRFWFRTRPIGAGGVTTENW